ncbi:MAG TPA: ABC transporter permease [Acidobacteriota bacterium]|nr:ABC transporter permease [Acidobacteriota bacterium]
MFLEIFRQAWESLWRSTTRTILTLSGMGWGVACFVLLFAYGDGFQHALDLGMAHYGKNVTVIWNGQTSLQAGGQRAGRSIQLELRDVEDIRANCPLVSRVSPEIFRIYPVKSRWRVTTTGVRGVNQDYGEMRGHYLLEGRTISAEDVRQARRVAVLGYDIKKKLLSEMPAVGEEVRINGLSFTVIGVLQKKVALSNYFQPDDRCLFIPHTAMAALTQTRYLSVLVYQSANPTFDDQAWSQVARILARNHRFDPRDEKAVSPMRWKYMQEIIGTITVGTKAFLLIMGIITLGIGGVGLMNVMLVSVNERTREIGLLKALGARPRHIRRQFLLEALLIALIGGFIGWALAELVTLVVGVIPFFSTILEDPTRQADIHLHVSGRACATAMITLGLVGVTAGFFPAVRAARLDPVRALHYE